MREKELRLALVCYGGISLAVYMHGVTREVWHLARASRGWHDGSALSAHEQGYADLLSMLEAASGTRLRVLADIVAGASAGGINGVFLAQAIATGQSLDPLTDLWLDNADVEALLAEDNATPSRLSALWATPIARAFAARQLVEDIDPEVRGELYAKLSRFVRARWFEPPFGGPEFVRRLLTAFDAMAAGPSGPRLLPDGNPIDLFVTVTDFAGHLQALPLHSPPEIVEIEHRLVLSFRDAPDRGVTLGAVPELVFAARATSSFPGAFPPFTVAELDGVLDEDARAWPGRNAFLARVLPSGSSDHAVLIDGSVLANAPFRPAIEALRNRPARREVDRRFVYIDPKPGKRSIGLAPGEPGAVPGFFTTLFGAMSDIPRSQPIRDNLEAIAAHSARVARTQRIVEALRPEVERAVETLFGRTLFLDRPTPARLAVWRARAADRAGTSAGHANVAYRELIRGSVAEALSRAAPQLPIAAIHDALTQHDTPEVLSVRVRIRRLRFLVRRLSALVVDDPGGEFEGVRDAAFAMLARLIERDGDAWLADLEARDATELVAMAEARLDLRAIDGETDAALAAAIAACPRPQRRAPLLAYLGFPFYDVATLPLLQGEGFGEFDPVQVDRIAPEDAISLADGTPPLKGTQFNSFGAFFSRAYRENDYLWGRLHGAERLVDIVVSALPPGAIDDVGVVAAKAALFTSILDIESERLHAIDDLVGALRERVAAMTRQV